VDVRVGVAVECCTVGIMIIMLVGVKVGVAVAVAVDVAVAVAVAVAVDVAVAVVVAVAVGVGRSASPMSTSSIHQFCPFDVAPLKRTVTRSPTYASKFTTWVVPLEEPISVS
jgi:hypothetical protein